MQSYAIGDIHGHIDLLRAAHDWIEADRAREGARDAPVVHVGDLVDRGPDSAGVIAHLRAGQQAGANWVVLKGNHDRMFARFLRDPEVPEPGLRSALSWLHPRIGGGETLASYGVRNASDRPLAKVHDDAAAAVPEADIAFIEDLPTWHKRGDVVFVHAGIRPGIPLDRQDESDLVWIREGFLEDTRDHGFLVVHGHTALPAPEHYGNRVNIDSSAAYGGPLTAVVIEGDDVWTLGPEGRSPLAPAARPGLLGRFLPGVARR